MSNPTPELPETIKDLIETIQGLSLTAEELEKVSKMLDKDFNSSRSVLRAAYSLLMLRLTECKEGKEFSNIWPTKPQSK